MKNWYLTSTMVVPKTHAIKGTAEHRVTKQRAWFESEIGKFEGTPELKTDLAAWLNCPADIALDTWLIWLESGGRREPSDILKQFGPLDTGAHDA